MNNTTAAARTATYFQFLPNTSELHYLKDKLVDCYLRLEHAEQQGKQRNIFGEVTGNPAAAKLNQDIVKLSRKIKAMERKAR